MKNLKEAEKEINLLKEQFKGIPILFGDSIKEIKETVLNLPDIEGLEKKQKDFKNGLGDIISHIEKEQKNLHEEIIKLHTRLDNLPKTTDYQEKTGNFILMKQEKARQPRSTYVLVLNKQNTFDYTDHTYSNAKFFRTKKEAKDTIIEMNAEIKNRCISMSKPYKPHLGLEIKEIL